MSKNDSRTLPALSCCLALIVGVRIVYAQKSQERFGPATEWSTVREPKLIEASGLAPATVLADRSAYWVHNDGDGQPRLYLLDQTGETQGVAELRDSAVDAEDLCTFDYRGVRRLLLGDTGDNKLQRPAGQLLFAYEPERTKAETNKKGVLRWNDVATVTVPVNYPGGTCNVEAVGVDPHTKLIIMISKEKKTGCTAFAMNLDEALDYDPQRNKPPKVTKLADLSLPTILGLAIHPAGTSLVALGREALFVFDRQPNETWAQSLTRRPIECAKPKQKQGEAVCWSTDGRTILLASEGESQPIWALPVK